MCSCAGVWSLAIVGAALVAIGLVLIVWGRR